MAELKTPGSRLAQTRRLWAVVLGEDMTQGRAAETVGASGAAWSRWESDQDAPRRDTLERIAAYSAELGLQGITAGWIFFGEGEGPPTIGSGSKPRPPARPAKPGIPQARSVAKSDGKGKRRGA